MFWIVILGVVIFIIYSFLSDKNEETNRIQRQGGFYLKYKELINYFSKYPRVVVERKNKTSITFAIIDKYAQTRFTISHGFESVTIFWSLNSITMGNHSLNWTFPETTPQSQMIKDFETKMKIYETNLLSGIM